MSEPPEKPRKESKDVVLVGGPTADGEGVSVLRAREERVEMGVLSPLRHGKPIRGEVVKLVPRPERPRLFDVETQVAAPQAPEPKAVAAGPAQVASEAYRRNWDAIWSRDGKRRSLPN